MGFIQIQNLSKIYMNGEEQITVFQDLTVTFERGKVIALTGPSGIGKSTFLQLLGTLDTPTSGEILIDGVNPFQLNDQDLSRFRNSSIGFIFQFHHLLPEFTALENVMMPGLIRGDDVKEVQRRAEKLLEMVGLRERLTHRPSELSGGERQRVAVVRALLNDPLIVLADEPTGNLDLENSESLMNLLKELNQKLGQTFIIATHNQEVQRFADEIYKIADKKIHKVEMD